MVPRAGHITYNSDFWPGHAIVVKTVAKVKPLEMAEALHVPHNPASKACLPVADPAEVSLYQRRAGVWEPKTRKIMNGHRGWEQSNPPIGNITISQSDR